MFIRCKKLSCCIVAFTLVACNLSEKNDLGEIKDQFLSFDSIVTYDDYASLEILSTYINIKIEIDSFIHSYPESKYLFELKDLELNLEDGLYQKIRNALKYKLKKLKNKTPKSSRSLKSSFEKLDTHAYLILKSESLFKVVFEGYKNLTFRNISYYNNLISDLNSIRNSISEELKVVELEIIASDIDFLKDSKDYNDYFAKAVKIENDLEIFQAKHDLIDKSRLDEVTEKLEIDKNLRSKEYKEYKLLVSNLRKSYGTSVLNTYYMNEDINAILNYLNRFQKSLIKPELIQKIDEIILAKAYSKFDGNPKTIYELNHTLDEVNGELERLNDKSKGYDIRKKLTSLERRRNSIYENEYSDLIMSFGSRMKEASKSFISDELGRKGIIVSSTDYIGEISQQDVRKFDDKLIISQIFESRVSTGLFGSTSRVVRVKVHGEIKGNSRYGASYSISNFDLMYYSESY